MKKGLIGIVILAFVALVCGPALAVTFESIDVTVDATLEWTVFDETGLMPEATKDGPTLALPELTLGVGAWEASTDGDYIKYTAEIGSISLKNSVGYNIYDLGAGIGEAQGIVLDTELASLSLNAVYTTDSEYGFGLGYSVKKGITATETTMEEIEVVDEETWAWIDDDENVETPPVWGHPMKTVEEEVEEEVAKKETVVDIGVGYNSTGAYGIQLVVPLAPVTLTGQYAPGEAAYLVKGEYALSAGTITLQYKVIDAAEISAALADFPIAATTLLGATITSTDGGITITGTAETTLVEGVTLTLNAASTEGALTCFGKIGVSF